MTKNKKINRLKETLISHSHYKKTTKGVYVALKQHRVLKKLQRESLAKLNDLAEQMQQSQTL